MKWVLVLVLSLFLSGCSKPQDKVLGFLTVDGDGIASHPFSVESEIKLDWGEITPVAWTALPLWFVGDITEDSLLVTSVQSYLQSPNEVSEVGAYYSIIEGGYQKRFEELWCEIYDKLNGVQEFSEVNGLVLQEMLQLVYQDESYGNLRDIVTDCLMFVRELNEQGPSEEMNERAEVLYNEYYGWFYNFTIDILKKE